jgi:beta-lactamase class A
MRAALVSAALLLVACSGGGGSPAATSTTSTSAVASTTSAAPATAPRPTTSRLQAALDTAVAGAPVAVSAVAVDLRNGARASHLATRVVWSASLYKLYVAHELFRRIDTGSLRSDDPSGDGAHTVAECLRLMIVVSDDGCGVAGLDMVGRGRLDPTLHADGFTGTFLDSPQRTTAADVARFFERERSAASPLYQLLREQQVNDRIPPALPPNTPLAHKTGDRTGWAHDAGVITTPAGDVIVVVLTGPWPSPCCHEERIGSLERRAFALIGAVARRVYDAAAQG